MTGLETTIYTVTNPPCVLERGPVEIADHEHQRADVFRGVVVRDTETGRYLGDCWLLAPMRWCWRTLDARHYGTTDHLRQATRSVIVCAKAA